jgi:hypothetical protein
VTKVLATIALGAVGLGLVAPSGAAAQSPSDREIAKAGALQAGDFPAGWRATPPKKSTDPFKCQVLGKAVARLRNQETARADSDDYERSQDQYSSSAVVFKSEDTAHRTYGVATSRTFQRCLERLSNDAVKKNVESQGFGVKVESGTVTGSGSYGDESSDLGFKITASKGGLNVDYFADIVFARVGRALGLYARVSTSEPSEFDTPTFDGLIRSATDRLTTATGGQPSRSASQSSTS